MGIELEWVKKITGEANEVAPGSFLHRFNSPNKITLCRNLQLIAKASKDIDTPANFSSDNTKAKNPKKWFLPKLVDIKSKISQLLLQPFYTSRIISLSFLKSTGFPSRKNFFVHLSEKSNLLVRSDNNTEFSSWKVLQTTTI